MRSATGRIFLKLSPEQHSTDGIAGTDQFVVHCHAPRVFLYVWAIVLLTLLIERVALMGGGRTERVALGLLILALGAVILSGLWFHVPVVLGFALIGVASVIVVRATGNQRRVRRGL